MEPHLQYKRLNEKQMVSQPLETREVLVERLGREGDGIAGALRIPGALPGETWAVPGTAGHGAEIMLRQVSAERVVPPCRLHGTCGGCNLQHASLPFLAGWKADVIVRALRAHGLETEILPTRTSPLASRRRAAFAGRRTRKGVRVGFHARRSEEIVPLETCLVVVPEILGAVPLLERITRIAAPRARAIQLQVTHGPAGLDLELAETKPLDASDRSALADLAREADLARLSIEGEPLYLARPPFQQMGSARVVPPPGAFLQATAEGEAALVESVARICQGADRIADLFSGCGTFALPLAAAASVHAVEGDANMLDALDRAWRTQPGLRQLATETRDLFRRPLLSADLNAFDAVVIDPPRAGAEAQAREIAGSRLGRVAYVSCNPATFARDAAILTNAGFRLDWVQPVDQFLWSGHVELVAQLAR
jgi:23S rRNA (uracil1939-C5)-methyltransferase